MSAFPADWHAIFSGSKIPDGPITAAAAEAIAALLWQAAEEELFTPPPQPQAHPYHTQAERTSCMRLPKPHSHTCQLCGLPASGLWSPA